MVHSRRKFFGIAGGAAAAGPSTLNAAYQSLGETAIGGVSMYPSGGNPRTKFYPVDDGSLMKGHYEHLRAEAAGNFDQPDALGAMDAIYGDVDALRSVSATARMRMRARRYAEHERRRRMECASRELELFMKANAPQLLKLGIF